MCPGMSSRSHMQCHVRAMSHAMSLERVEFRMLEFVAVITRVRGCYHIERDKFAVEFMSQGTLVPFQV